MTKAFLAYAPASAANLSAGFDLLGAALRPADGSPFGDEIIISASEGQDTELTVTGRYAALLPQDSRQNIVSRACALFAAELSRRGRSMPGVRMVLRKELPVCSGLGSSAASVVAAVVALNAFCGDVLSQDEQLLLMGQLEGEISGSVHYDNVAPCFLGGLQLIVGENGRVSVTLPDFDGWYFVSCFPGIKVSTSAARRILPAQYSRADAVTYARHLAAFTDACHRGDRDTAAACLVDVIAEPYRASLIPGFAEARAFGQKAGALATGISGSGSSVFSLFDDLGKAEDMRVYLEKNFIANSDGFCRICTIDRRGAYAESTEI